MRKLFAMVLSVTLLIISSVPMSVASTFCVIPVQTSAQHEMPDIDEGMMHETSHVRHDHGIALNGVWQHDRIECGCGCHNSIDSLPYMMAPHMASNFTQMTEKFSIVIPLQLETAWLVAAIRLPLPPPQT